MFINYKVVWNYGKIYKELQTKTKMDTIKEMIERWKATAEIFLKTDVKVFIKDSSNNYYFADILLVGEDTITIQCFGPPQKKDLKFTLYWPLITELKEYAEDKK